MIEVIFKAVTSFLSFNSESARWKRSEAEVVRRINERHK